MRILPKGVFESLDIWKPGLKHAFKWKQNVLKAFSPFEAVILKITFQSTIAMPLDFQRGRLKLSEVE